MKKKSPSAYAVCLALMLSLVVAMPVDICAQAAGQRAGEVSRVIPAVSIARNAKTITASAKTVVDWQDLVNTQSNARARIALDDGSVLNVGAESSLKVVKHDAGAQQTELELAYGKLRTQAQKIGKPDGKFEVRTPAGVAGVVGTDFYVGYDNGSTTMNVVVFEGSVKVCNLQGVCVIVKAGQMTNVRSGDNSGPTPPAQAPLDLLVAAGKDTDPGNPAGMGQGNGGFAGGHTAIVGILIGIPIAVITGVVIHNNKTSQPTPSVPVNPCVTNPKQCG
jgi:ferric-dicitrate binding protein FerR (iron transport regulator)